MAKAFEPGDLVHYDPGYKKPENGIVKEVTTGGAFVVYHCGDDWDNYQNYTGALTKIEHLNHGWVH